MKESIGNAYIFGIVIFFVGIIMLFFVASLNYSKAFRVKNRIINIIEVNGEYNNSDVKAEINSALSTIGYRHATGEECEKNGRFNYEENADEVKTLTVPGTVDYHYCVYEYSQGEKGKYYGVVAYMYFEIPLIGKTLEFPVYGETKTLGLLG